MPIGDLLAQISGDTPPPRPTSFTSGPKRKADNDLQRTNDKQVKREINTANTSRPVFQVKSPPNLDTSPGSSTSRPGALTASFVSKSAQSTSSTPNGSAPATPKISGPAKVPKKGSFAEIMARGKVAQANLGQIGKIQHKRIEKGLSKRERQELKEEQKQKSGSNGRSRPAGEKRIRHSQNNVRDSGQALIRKSRSALPEKKAKKAALATTGYTGTARPIPGSGKSSRPISAHRTGGRDSSSSTRNRHASEEAEEDEEDMEEEEDYGSDASSDMEAAAFEVDEEEERAARIAKMEDEDALREENAHRKAKEEKRRILVAMAQKRR